MKSQKITKKLMQKKTEHCGNKNAGIISVLKMWEVQTAHKPCVVSVTSTTTVKRNTNSPSPAGTAPSDHRASPSADVERALGWTLETGCSSRRLG